MNNLISAYWKLASNTGEARGKNTKKLGKRGFEGRRFRDAADLMPPSQHQSGCVNFMAGELTKKRKKIVGGGGATGRRGRPKGPKKHALNNNVRHYIQEISSPI